MASVIITLRSWTPLPDNVYNDNYNLPRAPKMAAWGQMLNHVIGRQHRIVFSTWIGKTRSPTVNADPLLRFRYRQTNPHGTELVYCALAIPGAQPGATTTAARFGLSPSGPYGESGSRAESPLEPGDIFECSFVEPITVASAFVNRTILVEGGFRLIGLVVYERPNASCLLDDTLNCYDPQAVASGAIVRDTPLIRMRRALFTAWGHQRKHRSWSAIGTAAQSTTSTSFVSVHDNVTTARSSTSPGVLVREYLSALALGSSVPMVVAVLAKVSGGTGTIKAESSLGGTGDTTVSATTEAWHTLTGGGSLACNATEARGAGLADDKVDIFYKKVTSGTIYVYGYLITPFYP